MLLLLNKMRPEKLTEKTEVPEGCTLNYQNYEIIVKGPKGELTRKVDTPKIKINMQGKDVVLEVDKPSKREKRMIYTYLAHIKNMFKGVTEGHAYKLKICSGHFPMNVTYKNNILEVKNFLGEKIPRKLAIKEGVDLKVEGDTIIIQSVNKELAGQVCSDIEKLTRRPGFDKRIFQDGIYLTEKDNKKL